MKAGMAVGCAVLVTLLLMVPAQACQLPAGWLTMKGSAKQTVRAAISISHDGITVGAPFAVDLAVCDAGNANIERITIDATMPRHRHGMNYKPSVADLGNDRYRAQSFVFHMPGLWRIVVTAYQSGQPIYLERDFQVQ